MKLKLIKSSIVTFAVVLLAQTIAMAEEKQVFELDNELILTVDKLERTKSGTLMFKFTIENPTDSKVSLSFLNDGRSPDIEKLELMNLTSRQKFLPLEDSASRCLCSSMEYNDWIEAGKKRKFWGHFTEPPKDMTELSLVLFDNMMPLDGLKIAP